MIELRLDWKAIAFAVLLYFVLNDETIAERVKKNTISTLGHTDNRQARINRRHELTMTEFDAEFYQTTGKVIEDYERNATPPRTFAR